MKVRLVTGIVTMVALVSGLSLAAPTSASAHQIDALHQHAFSQYPICQTNLDGTSTVGLQWPVAAITAPTRAPTQSRVWLTARIEYFSYHPSNYGVNPISGQDKPWVYVYANERGPQSTWIYHPSGQQASGNPFTWRVASGFYYRVHLYFYWEADRAMSYDYDVTNWCLG